MYVKYYTYKWCVKAIKFTHLTVENMACSTGRCALRRFDGHGTSSYRPTNPEVAREFQSRMDQLLAERSRQDQGVFTMSSVNSVHMPVVQTPVVQPIQMPVVNSVHIPIVQPQYYSLSDSK